MRGSTGRLALERADGRGESRRGGERVCALQLCGGGAHGVRAVAARPGRGVVHRGLLAPALDALLHMHMHMRGVEVECATVLLA